MKVIDDINMGPIIKDKLYSSVREVLNELSKRLTDEFGKGFTLTNLRYMRMFYLAFPIHHALRDELSWTHYVSFPFLGHYLEM